MAELVILPQTTTGLEPPPQGRRRPRALNTIMEEENEDVVSPVRSPFLRKTIARDRTQQDRNRVQAWLAPLDAIPSEEVTTPKGFPTPRGFHFMTAPTLSSSPSSPSSASASGEEGSSQDSYSRTNSWNRQSAMTDVTEFDDLYGVSDDEGEQSFAPVVPPKTPFDEARKALPQLVIPGEQQSNDPVWSPKHEELFKTLASPVPPTPPSAVIMSPAMLVYMQAQHAHPTPGISAPPSLDGSLDGSLTSEQLAAMSAPPTPVMSSEDSEDSGDSWPGVQLQPGAMATLQSLSGQESEEHQGTREEHVFEVSEIPMTESRPSRPRLITNNFSRESIMLSPAQQRTLGGLTQLDIPSPGGFFSGLSPHTRTTWHLSTSPADDMAPPTSTTAEQFYRIPWSMNDAPPMPSPPKQLERTLHITHGDFSSSPVEHVVEMLEPIKDEDVLTARRVEEPVTAKRVPPYQPSTVSEGDDEDIYSPSSPKEEDHVAEIVVDYDPNYARKQQEIAVSHIDRTEVWLRAQFSYMRGVSFELPEGAEDSEKAEVKKAEETEAIATELEQPPTPPPKGPLPQLSTAIIPAPAKKKSVRFSAKPTFAPAAGNLPVSLPSKLLQQESAYYRAFQSMTVRATQADVFVHRLPRFEALQAERVALREQHRDRLLGKYQLSVMPQSAKKRMSANVARGDDEVFEDAEKMRMDKEGDALKQMCTANWHVAALKMLNGGKLACAPVHKRLARLSMAPQGRGGGRNRLRILDLGGQAACDWAWHAALQYPNAKVYTVTTKAIRQLSNSNIRGPPNHRQVAVNSLWRLPFANDQFDLISARELHSILKASDMPGSEDEWDLCLREIMRVLKPGGYFEFNVMDSDIVNAGPLGLAKSVEFGFTLKTLGCDPSPTKTFLSRLSHEGYEDVRRAWVVLPLGPKPVEKPGPVRYGPNGPEHSPPAGGNTISLDAMAPGSLPGSTDDAAAIAGVAGTWSWERWILRCEMEKANGELRSGFKLADTVSTDGGVVREAEKSLRGVHAVVEEGRGCGAGLRVLKGFARKPEVVRSITQEVLDVLDSMEFLDF